MAIKSCHFRWADVESGRISRGPRFADAAANLPAGGFTTFAIADADSYFAAVKAQGIVLDRDRTQTVDRAAGGGSGKKSGRRHFATNRRCSKK